MNLSSLKFIVVGLFVMLAAGTQVHAGVINIFCESNSSSSRGKQFSMVGVLTEGDFGDELRGKFTFNLVDNGDLVETKLSTYKTVGVVEHNDFQELVSSDTIKISFINKNSEFSYIEIALYDQTRKKSRL